MSKLASLYEGAKIQESLLQSYRKIQIGTQSVLLVIGFLCAFELLDLEDGENALYLLILYFSILLLAIIFLFKTRKLIHARAGDVDYWHLKILKAEQGLDYKKRHFTQFKVFQKLKQEVKQKEFETLYATLAELQTLIGKEKGHTRRVLDDQLMWGYLGMWVILTLTILISIS